MTKNYSTDYSPTNDFLELLLNRMLEIAQEYILKQKQLYIAGPMSGYPEFNFPAFFAAQDKYQRLGYKVWNPAAKDMEDAVHNDASFETGDDKQLMESGWSFEEAFLWDVTKVCQSRTICMLPGWQFSPGAIAEHAVAVSMKKRYPEYEIIYEV